ncbi:MAG: CapA family protein [Lachnospiraceae bacterium]|nr:CapA family protein [Lachnospiraceae bacterium]
MSKNVKILAKKLISSLLTLAVLSSSVVISGNKNATESAEAATTKADTITISAAGDCTFGSDYTSPSSVNFYSVYNKQNNAYFFKKVRKVFKKDDMSIVNFEGVLTKRTTRADKKYAFKGNPSYYKILKKGNIEAVAFANNHCRDYGTGSYDDTTKIFRKQKIRYSSYSRVGTYKTKGRIIGMVSVCGLEGYSYSAALVKAGIKKLKKKNADIIIVSMHAGVEYQTTPESTQINLAHYAVEQGADLVLGHHPHILQGIEKYKGVFICYSLGNFCFGGNTNPREKDTMIFRKTFRFKKNGKVKKDNKARIVPCSLSGKSYINNYQPVILKGSEKVRVIKKINSYSKKYGVRFNKKGKFKLRK